jgi:hypothetical protein
MLIVSAGAVMAKMIRNKSCRYWAAKVFTNDAVHAHVAFLSQRAFAIPLVSFTQRPFPAARLQRSGFADD